METKTYGHSFPLRKAYLGGILLLGSYLYWCYAKTYFHLTSRPRDSIITLKIDEEHTVRSTLTSNVAVHIAKNCSEHPQDLDGKFYVNFSVPLSFDDIPALHNSVPPLRLGGKWKPQNCTAYSSLAVVMTYRNRSNNIKLILQHLHPFLQKQLIEYQMFIIEPPLATEFNRGLLKNIGFVESERYCNFKCVVFHDIDLLPENDKNLYHCHNSPRHLVVSIDTRRYRPLFGGAVFGGAVLFEREQFRKVNGYSNYYFGWGGEDDDLLNRVRQKGMNITRPSPKIGRYKEAIHDKDKKGKTVPIMYKLRRDRFDVDGLNSLHYDVIDVHQHRAFTWIKVTYNETLYKLQAKQATRKALEKLEKRKVYLKAKEANISLTTQGHLTA